uniref:protein Njmu-R1 n=1 Tax=Myxine glutinosa TaxID=7769 RepID=UPI00358F521E
MHQQQPQQLKRDDVNTRAPSVMEMEESSLFVEDDSFFKDLESTEDQVVGAERPSHTWTSHFAIFAYQLTRLDTDKVLERPRQGSITEIQRREVLADDVSIGLVAGDLPSDVEEELSTFVSRRVARDGLYRGIGSVVSLTLGGTEDVTACYCCLLDQEESKTKDELSEEKSGQKDMEPVEGDGDEPEKEEKVRQTRCVVSKGYVVCFLGQTEKTLELFRQELDKYSKGVWAYLNKEADSPSGELVTYLESWLPDAIFYLQRVVEAVREDSAFLLHAAMTGAAVQVTGAHDKLDTDIIRFVQTSTLEGVGGERLVATALKRQAIVVDCSEEKPHFQHAGVNKFCEAWAEALVRGLDTGSLFVLRQILENFKLKAIQDINTFQRLLRRAESDHYALYRCLRFLRSCGNGAALLLVPSGGSSGSEETRLVLQVLEEFAQENGEEL